MGDSDRYRPLMGGIQVDAAGLGSVGGVVRSRTNPAKILLLSNAHVLGTTIGPVIGQPSLCRSWRKCTRANEIGAVFNSIRNQKIDAAVATVFDTLDRPLSQIRELLGSDAKGNPLHGVIQKQHDPIPKGKTQAFVRMRGAASGTTTYGVITYRRDVPLDIRNKVGFENHGKPLETWEDQLEIHTFPNRHLPRPADDIFAHEGDSGSLLVTWDPTKKPQDDTVVEVIGLVYAGGKSSLAFATPIENVLDALQVDLVLGTAPVAVAPSPVAPSLAGLADDAPALSTPTGRVAAELFDRHAAEVMALARTKARVSVVWRHNGGPEIAQALFESARHTELALPSEVNGRSVATSMIRVLDTLAEYGSPGLRADIARCRPLLAGPGGATHFFTGLAEES